MHQLERVFEYLKGITFLGLQLQRPLNLSLLTFNDFAMLTIAPQPPHTTSFLWKSNILTSSIGVFLLTLCKGNHQLLNKWFIT
ncbi:hypothetical protein CR513_54065, partial [Mucuna pruriens]